MLRHARSGVTLLLVLAFAGCREDAANTSPLGPGSKASTAQSQLPTSKHARVDENVFVEMAAETPSFAGFYINKSGRTVVRVVDLKDGEQVRRSMMLHVRKEKFQARKDVANGELDVQVAEYSFLQLSKWRDLVFEQVLNMDGVVYDDLDEVRNRVVIGISQRNGVAQASVVDRLKSLGIPLAAIAFVTADRVVPAHEGISTSTSLTMDPDGSILGPYSAIGGGYRIGPSGCTATFVGEYGGSAVLATASHCTSATYQLDGSKLTSWDGAIIGSESADPSATSQLCVVSFNCYPARGSDAALFTLNGVMPSVRGAIARLTVRSSTLPPTTTFEVNTSYPWFYITSTSGWHPVGRVVEKVGRMTGWTYGDITESCIDVRLTNGYAVRCANRVHMWAAGGDSGSPVFSLNDPFDPYNSAVELMGTLSAVTASTTYNGQTAGEYSLYTSYAGLAQELPGYLNPLSNVLGAVYLNGALSAAGGVVLDWNAVTASGLSTPTEYQIWTWQTTQYYDEYGWPYSVAGPTSVVTTTTSTSFTSDATYYTSTNCGDGDFPVDHYRVAARNQGIQNLSSEVCFQP